MSIAPLLSALSLENQGKFAEASHMRGRALEDAPATSGTLNVATYTAATEMARNHAWRVARRHSL